MEDGFPVCWVSLKNLLEGLRFRALSYYNEETVVCAADPNRGNLTLTLNRLGFRCFGQALGDQS